MQVVRPVCRRHAALLLRPRYMRRSQHSNYGPHKEYFQNPEQSPVQAYRQFTAPEPVITNQTTHVAPTAVPIVASRHSRPVRFFKSVFWALLFGITGVAAGTGLITWEYLQPPFPPGSPEQEELYSSIMEMLETHPLVEGLRNDKWIEEDYYFRMSQGTLSQGMALVREKLIGTEGVTIKAFKHSTLQYTILVLFAGFGIEGWPDTVHGGIISSLLIEGAERHITNYYADFATAEKSLINIDFKAPVRPGEVYAVLVPPAGISESPEQPTEKILSLATLLMRMEAAPRLTSQFDPITKTETHTIEILTPDGVDVTHATAAVEIRLPSTLSDNRDQPESTDTNIP